MKVSVSLETIVSAGWYFRLYPRDEYTCHSGRTLLHEIDSKLRFQRTFLQKFARICRLKTAGPKSQKQAILRNFSAWRPTFAWK